MLICKVTLQGLVVALLFASGCGPASPPAQHAADPPPTTVVAEPSPDEPSPDEPSPDEPSPDEASAETDVPEDETSANTSGTKGKLAPAIIQRIVRSNFGAFRNCYNKEIASDPEFSVRIDARFVIAPTGRVSSSSAKHRDADGSKTAAGAADPDGHAERADRVGTCVATAVSTIEFPEPEGGSVTVSYPIIFTPKDKK